MLSKCIHITNRYIIIVLLGISSLLFGCSLPLRPSTGNNKTHTHKRKNLKKLSSKHDNAKLHTKAIKKWDVLDLFRNEQKRRELKCPSKKKEKENEKGKFKEPTDAIVEGGASVKRFTRSIHFDIIELETTHLDIPAFKQFKNNMTDFTHDGEEQFKQIIKKIHDFLGTNTNGEGVTLRIVGSASQIPTSYDPSLPNNNINVDGSSIYGQTSIENNKKLAQARALELAKKIKEVFGLINIETPLLADINLGETAWDEDAQSRLAEAHIKGDEAGKQQVFEPYQKEQFVKVESQDSYVKTVKPESIDMYMVSVRPKIIYDYDNGKPLMISSFIVSKDTYNKIGGTLRFENVAERDLFLRKEGLERIYDERHGKQRWFLYDGQDELNAIEINDEYERIFKMYELGMVDEKDKEVLKEIIRKKYLKSHKPKDVIN